MSSRHILPVAAAIALATPGCADWSRGVRAPEPEEPPADGGGGAGFAASVHPVLVAACGVCHGANGEASHTGFVLTGVAGDDYPTTMAFVEVDAATSSRLLIKMSGAGHGGGVVFTNGSPEFAAVLRWIREGASP